MTDLSVTIDGCALEPADHDGRKALQVLSTTLVMKAVMALGSYAVVVAGGVLTCLCPRNIGGGDEPEVRNG